MAAMSLLQALRQSRFIARCVLVWFAVAMAAAVAAPIVNPQATAIVCSAAGEVKLVNAGGDAPVPASLHGMDCVLCLAVNAPPATYEDPQIHLTDLSFVLQTAPVALVHLRTAVPTPARGPPVL